jgi:inhibitor of KinA
VGDPVILPAGDSALVLRLGELIDPAVNDRVLAALATLDRAPLAGVVDLVPGYASLMVVYDPARTGAAAVEAWMTSALAGAQTAGPERRRVEIPVFYDRAVAPDLEALAEEKGMSVEALVALHAGATYRCYLVGFRPGFPFLGGLDPRLFSARLPTPRLRVPAGAVGIGGQQTGVYPVASPGGWRLIGRTPLRLFDAERAEPCAVRAGDEVAFVPVDRARYLALGGVVDSGVR